MDNSALISGIFTLLLVLTTFFGLGIFMAGAYLLAEYFRRERTPDKDDDWNSHND